MKQDQPVAALPPVEADTPESDRCGVCGGNVFRCECCTTPGFDKPSVEADTGCVCEVPDGLVQEWVSKARAVARGKGFDPKPRPLPPVEADTMPTIEVGDVLFLHEFGHLYGNHTEVTSKEIADWFNRPENIVVAIYRDPLWRRPSPQEPTFFVSPEKEQG